MTKYLNLIPILFVLLVAQNCKTPNKDQKTTSSNTEKRDVVVGANQVENYIGLLKRQIIHLFG